MVESSSREQVRALVTADQPVLVEMRRHLHAHPELSGQEHATTAWIGQHLHDLGLAPKRLDIGTGLVCDIALGDVDAHSPTVALRADIDALAMPDEKQVGYRSTVDGVAHACGHDAHTVAVLGAARALVALAPISDVAGTVRLIFEPSEESVPGGAVDVISEGWLDGVNAVFGVHCDPRLDCGVVGLHAGAITSAADLVELRVTGPGGHTARPERTVDLVAALGRLITGMQPTLDSLTTRPGDLNLVFGAVHSGDAPNVVPSHGLVRGSLRTRDHGVWEDAPRLVEQATARLLEGSGAAWTMAHRRGVPPVVNEPEMTALLALTAARV
ncbi:MAG TPA: amidohydrolase, partial [Candidatus Nanopelagicales bacterium]|nr:amidohydrolase [Candidatus Nanopelagicales bacterium]